MRGIGYTVLLTRMDIGMILRFASTVIGALAFAPVAAIAADLPLKSAPQTAAPPIPLASWGGPYAGAFIGGGAGSFSTSQNGFSASSSGFGVASGALAGYNWQSGLFVYGLESDIGYNVIRAKFTASPGFAANQAESIYTLEARGRLGYDLGAYMPYLSGGVVYTRLDQSLQPPLEFYGASKNRAGWTLGAGVDAKVSLPILGASVLRAEYVYRGLPSSSFDFNGQAMSTRLSTQYVRFALISPVGVWRPSVDLGPADWSGGYFGVIGAGQSNNISTKGPVGSANFNASGAAGGIYAGHNWMFGNAMLGFDGATMIADVSGSGAQPGAALTNYRTYLSGDLRGRVGYSLGRFMPFAAVGLGFDNTQQSEPATGRYQGNAAFVSGLAGLGVDYMASERVALRAEYLYGHTLSATATHLDSENCCNQTRSSNSLRLGVAYFFH
jgi:outer membrane immunogenic protein